MPPTPPRPTCSRLGACCPVVVVDCLACGTPRERLACEVDPWTGRGMCCGRGCCRRWRRTQPLPTGYYVPPVALRAADRAVW